MEIVLPLTSLPLDPRLLMRHTVVPGTNVSAGQAALVPVQNSAVSHSGPDEGRHTVVAGWKPSVGHSVLDPVQLSGTSHGPAAARQSAPGLPAGCWQAALLPLHWSSVQGFVSAVQGVPDAALASAG